MSSIDKVDWKAVAALSFVILLAIGLFFFSDVIFQVLRIILEKDYLKNTLSIGIVPIIIFHSYRIKGISDNSAYIIKSKFIVLDVVLSCATYLSVSTTACSLLKGAFIQKFYGVTYFTNFEQLNIAVLIGVSALLIAYVLTNMYSLASEAVIVTKTEKIAP